MYNRENIVYCTEDSVSVFFRRPRLFSQYGSSYSAGGVMCKLPPSTAPYAFAFNQDVTAPHRTAPKTNIRTTPHRVG